jgi:hypothetical protein
MLRRFNIHKIWDVFDIARPIIRGKPLPPIRTKEEQWIDVIRYDESGEYVLLSVDEYNTLTTKYNEALAALDVAISTCNNLTDELADTGHELYLLKNEHAEYLG